MHANALRSCFSRITQLPQASAAPLTCISGQSASTAEMLGHDPARKETETNYYEAEWM